MPHIYITDESKEKLDGLVQKEQRTISKEVEFLIDRRQQELSAPSEKENPQSVSETPDKKDINNPCSECQAKKEV